MSDHEKNTSRIILAHTLYSNNNSGGLLGFVKPLAEIVGDNLIELNSISFCPSMKVFITSNYDEIEKKFPNNEIFKLEVNLSERASDNVDPTYACKYVSGSKYAEQIKPKEYFEIIKSDLPDSNDRVISLNTVYPGTRYIFIDDGKKIYGPLKWMPINDSSNTINIIRLEFIDGPLPGVKLAQYQIYKIDKKTSGNYIISSNDSTGNRYITQGLSILSNSDFHDYSSDDEVVRYCAKLAVDNNIKIVEKSKMDSLASYLLKTPRLNVPLIKQRLARLPDIAVTISELQIEITENFSKYLNSENGKEIVFKYVEKNESRFLDVLKKDRESELNALMESKYDEIKSAEARLKELNENKVNLSVQVEELKKATKQEVVLDLARADADIKLKQKKIEIIDLEKIIYDKKGLAEGLMTLENITKKIEAAEQNQKYTWKKENELKSIIDNLQIQLGSTEDSLRKKLTELKPFVEAINGSFVPDDITKNEIYIKANELKSDEVLVVRQRLVISEIQTRLSKRGRNLSDFQIANILISTQQSFISFFAGLPGVGKTSLARLIAELQDIKPRMQEVSVARGWTSQKDLIGFFNPLTSRLQPSNTGLYSFLMALSNEKKDQNQAMAYVLLDEANLSPIEHYWSSFMAMTDGEGDRTLNLGQDEIKISDCLRFMATINYDGTTEPLSPRIVDRAPIIVIEPSELAIIQIENDNNNTSFVFPISSIQMQELFGNEIIIPELEDDEKLAFDRVRRTLLDSDPAMGRPLSISPRKEISIRQYCAKARGIMNSENEFLALDFAILQHILPLIRGNGNRFGKRLEALRRDLDASSLPRSSEFVSRMISFGEDDLHTYDFFCW